MRYDLALALCVPAALFALTAQKGATESEPAPVLLAVSTEASASDVVHVEIPWSGPYAVDGVTIPMPDPGSEALVEMLAARAGEMPTREGDVVGSGLPAGRVLLHVDRDARFVDVQRLMAACAAPGVALWDIGFAVERADGVGPGVLSVPLPIGEVPEDELTIQVRVVRPGDLGRTLTGDRSTYAAKGRTLEYTLGTRVTENFADVEELFTASSRAGVTSLVIDARRDTLQRDVVQLMDAAHRAGITAIRFSGARK